MIHTMKFIIHVCLAFLPLWALAAEDLTRPNIVLLMSDDQGWGDVGYNGHPHIQTPELDEIAATGVRFDEYYAPASTCAPSRAAILTGRHNMRVGIMTPSVKRWHLDENEITLAEALRDAGYATAHYGKWHLGTLYTETDGEHNLFPSDAGFDEYFTSENILYTYDPYQGLPTNKPEDHMYVDNGRFISLKEGQARPELRRDDTEILADKAVDFMTRKAGEKRPFLVLIWFHHVHAPLSDNPELVKLYPDVSAKEATYFSNVTSIDRAVGRVRKALRELGVADNTLLWFSSDNGPHANKTDGQAPDEDVLGKDFRYTNRGSAGPYRAGKWRAWEGGIRVPSVIEWPAVVKKPLRSNLRCNGLDVFPTLLDIIGKPLPADRSYDGVSILPHLRGEEQNTDAHPRVFANGNQRAWMEGRYKIVTGIKKKSGHFDQLYDLEKDPYERVNLIRSMPEVFTRLFRNYQAWEKAALQDASDGVSEITKDISATAEIK